MIEREAADLRSIHHSLKSLSVCSVAQDMQARLSIIDDKKLLSGCRKRTDGLVHWGQKSVGSADCCTIVDLEQSGQLAQKMSHARATNISSYLGPHEQRKIGLIGLNEPL